MSSTRSEMLSSSVHVFVADEDDALRGEVAAALRADGYDVSECADGSTLFRQLEHRLAHRGARRSIVIAQARLPGFGTFRILHSLRALDVSIPVILMTRLRDPSLANVAESAGASAVLIKPVDLRDLRRVVAELVEAIAESESLDPLEPTRELGGGSREAIELSMTRSGARVDLLGAAQEVVASHPAPK